MIKDNVSYRGKVKVAIKKGKNIISKTNHNAGLPDMAMLFAKAITGNLDYGSDIPRLLDIGYTVKSTESPTESSLDNAVWESILNHPCAIGGRQFKYDASLKNWVGILTTTVLATDLNGALLDNVLKNLSLIDEDTGEAKYTLKIRLCSYRHKNRKYFAEIEPDNPIEFISTLRDSTSAIITWYCELLYNEDDSSNTVIGKIQGGDN